MQFVNIDLLTTISFKFLYFGYFSCMENLRNINPIKVDKTTIINLEKGKLPPQALDLEEAVFWHIVKSEVVIFEVVGIALNPEGLWKL